jgi:predicted transcriptional regulator of viral defense system
LTNRRLYFYGVFRKWYKLFWITVPRGSWLPKVEYPPIRYITATEKCYTFGVTTKIIDSSSIKIYTIAKTIADCFKHRNKVGINVAIDALKEARQKKLVTIDEIVEAAKVNRVFSVMRPYLEAIV